MDFGRILKNVSKHIQLTEQETRYFTSLLKLKELKKKELLLQAGQVCRHENFVINGCLRMFTVDTEGTEHIVMFAPEDWWVSDMYSFLTQTPAHFTIEAIEETQVLQIEKGELDSLFLTIPKFDRLYRILLQNAFVAQQQRITQNLSFTAEQRYETFLKRYPQLENRLPQKWIASYLGITPEFLSMLRRKIAKG